MKVLIICESASNFFSGGKVVRYLANILKQESNQVKLLILNTKGDSTDTFYSNNDVQFFPFKLTSFNRIISIFFYTKINKFYCQTLDEYKPDVVHFASFLHDKPPSFIRLAKVKNVRIVLQPWTMHFFCHQGFSYRNNQTCTICSDGKFFNSVKYGCLSFKKMPIIIIRHYLKKYSQLADVVLSSNSSLDDILSTYGIDKNKIARFPIPFDYTQNKNIDTQKDKDYFCFYGQANGHKGFDILLKAFSELPYIKLKAAPMNNVIYAERNSNVEIIYGLSWSNGLRDLILSAKAIIIPSVWPTTTEYALCEALELQKPVVVFNVGIHKDILKNNYNAIVVPVDIDKLKEAIVKLNNNEVLRKQIGKNGYLTLTSINNREVLYNSIKKIYKNL